MVIDNIYVYVLFRYKLNKKVTTEFFFKWYRLCLMDIDVYRDNCYYQKHCWHFLVYNIRAILYFFEIMVTPFSVYTYLVHSARANL